MRCSFSQMKVQLIIKVIIFVLLNLNSTVFADVLINEFTTPKNIRVFLVEDKTTELVSVFFAFKGAGAKTDPAGQQGLVSLLTQLLTERTTEGSDRFTLQKRFKELGVMEGIQQSVDSDNIIFHFKCPLENLKHVFETVKLYFNDPSLDPKELSRIKGFDPSSSRLTTSSEQEFANKILIQKLFSGHPYSYPAMGTIEGRQSVTIEDAKDAFKKRFTRDILAFSVIGNVSEKTIGTYIDDAFGSLPETAKLPKISAAKLETTGEIFIIPKECPQSGVVFGQEAIPIQNADYIPFIVLNDILGGRAFTSRLWENVREKEGLVYSIQTSMSQWEHAQLLMGAFESENSVVQRVIALIRKEWESLKEKGVSEAEFKASKTGLIGGYVLGFTSPDGIAQSILSSYLYDLPTNYINEHRKKLENVKLEEVNRVAAKYLAPDKLTFVVVGDVPQE